MPWKKWSEKKILHDKMNASTSDQAYHWVQHHCR